MTVAVDTKELEAKVQRMYRAVATAQHGDHHFELGRSLAVVRDADLRASCIGGAAQQGAYRHAIEAAGPRIEQIRPNPYEFISQRARDASAKYGVKSVSLPVRKER